MQKTTFTKACNEFFGKKPGQTLIEFRDELRALTEKDKTDLAEMFKTVSYEIVPA